MNVRSELRLEIVRDNLSYTLLLPGNSSHDVAHQVCNEFAATILEMKKQAEALRDAQKAEQPA